VLVLGNFQAQVSGDGGLNNIFNIVDVKAVAEVREQDSDAFFIVERLFCFASIIVFSSY